MNARRIRRAGAEGRRFALAAMAGLALGSQAGCTREFFREWANQDVSEAVFEKSRDPRWRLDSFSVESPALSRFADPYDQDAPPAPPDDVATEALSPVPQWPSNRLIVPAEGTGYLELLENWRRQDLETAAAEGRPVPPPGAPGVDLPENLGFGGVPPSLSTDPASRPGVPFQPYPGMADPYQPGGIIDPNRAIDADQPAGATGMPIEAESGRATFGGVRPPMPPGGYGRPDPNADVAPGTGTPAGPAPPIPPPTPLNPPGAAAPSAGPPGPSASSTPTPRDGVTFPVVRLQDGGTSPNSGTKTARSTPISVAKGATDRRRPQIPPPRSPFSQPVASPTSPTGGKDRMVARSRTQDRAVARTTQVGVGGQTGPGGQSSGPPPREGYGGQSSGPAPREGYGGQPSGPTRRPGTLDPDIRNLPAIPGAPLDRQEINEAGRMNREQAIKLYGVLVPEIPPMDEAEAAGLPKGLKAFRLDMQRSWLLALINARYYQYQLEQLYLSALPVTQQRFAFEPQFYAGLSPVTGVPQGSSGGGGSFATASGLSTANSFTYATRFAPTGQVSTMNIGTVAGVGKLFSSGGQLLMGFANELVFNFAGKNPRQPTVLSALPISFYQPLLRGAGRAVVLEPLTQAERNLLYQVRAFTQFRQQFFVVTLTGGTVQNFGNTFQLAGFTSGGNVDPTIGFIPAAFNVVQVEIDRRNVAFYESLVKLYQELIQGESSGLSQLQVDQTMSQLIGARYQLYSDKLTYRYGIDNYKIQLGMPPDTPIVMDQTFLGKPFYDVFNAIDKWQRRPERNLNELPGIIGKLPQLPDLDIDGRSVLGIYRNYRASAGSSFVPEDEDGLEDLLQAAVRVGLEYRMDLMNARAELYDAWRQIRVAANALKGVLNITLTNNTYTGPYTTNPFAFLSQAKNFSLVLQTELPLVRMTERNAFRQALITYQRQRRNLMTAEDDLKIQLRQDLRAVHQYYINYEINKRNYELNVRLKDQAFEQIVAPPASGGSGLAQSANAATQTTNLLNFQGASYGSQIQLITSYETYQQNRLIFYRDIGTLPYDEWEAFRELFPTQYHGPILTPAGGGSVNARPGLAGDAEAVPPPPPNLGG